MGHMTPSITRRAAALLGAAAALPAQAQTQPEAAGALATRLAYVVSGDEALDELQRQGLIGLSDFVNRRTAAALAEPMAVVPGETDLALFPLLYWAISPHSASPSAAALARSSVDEMSRRKAGSARNSPACRRISACAHAVAL